MISPNVTVFLIVPIVILNAPGGNSPARRAPRRPKNAHAAPNRRKVRSRREEATFRRAALGFVAPRRG